MDDDNNAEEFIDECLYYTAQMLCVDKLLCTIIPRGINKYVIGIPVSPTYGEYVNISGFAQICAKKFDISAKFSGFLIDKNESINRTMVDVIPSFFYPAIIDEIPEHTFIPNLITRSFLDRLNRPRVAGSSSHPIICVFITKGYKLVSPESEISSNNKNYILFRQFIRSKIYYKDILLGTIIPGAEGIWDFDPYTYIDKENNINYHYNANLKMTRGVNINYFYIGSDPLRLSFSSESHTEPHRLYYHVLYVNNIWTKLEGKQFPEEILKRGSRHLNKIQSGNIAPLIEDKYYITGEFANVSDHITAMLSYGEITVWSAWSSWIIWSPYGTDINFIYADIINHRMHICRKIDELSFLATEDSDDFISQFIKNNIYDKKILLTALCSVHPRRWSNVRNIIEYHREVRYTGILCYLDCLTDIPTDIFKILYVYSSDKLRYKKILINKCPDNRRDLINIMLAASVITYVPSPLRLSNKA